jgi:membrane protease YdiL (CAAX protease family)
LLNTAAGVVFGWLYWRHNLETAMIAHASVHLALGALSLIGWS